MASLEKKKANNPELVTLRAYPPKPESVTFRAYLSKTDILDVVMHACNGLGAMQVKEKDEALKAILSLLTVSERAVVAATRDTDKLVETLLGKCALNQIPTVKAAITRLAKHTPYFAEYARMLEHPGDAKKKSKTVLAVKAQSFLTSTTIPRIKEEKEMPSKQLTSEQRLMIASLGDDIKKVYRPSAQRVLLSTHFCCAGDIMQPELPCAHGCVLMDNSAGSADLSTFQFDHAIAFSQLGLLYDLATEEIGADKALQSELLQFIRHLCLGTALDKERGWPANVYVRCKACNAASEHGAGGSTHKKVWEAPPPPPTK